MNGSNLQPSLDYGLSRPAGSVDEIPDPFLHQLRDVNASPDPALLERALLYAFWAGDLSAAHRLVRQYGELAGQSPLARWRELRAQAALSFARGSIEASRRQALEALQVVRDTELESESLVYFGYQIIALLRERCRLGDGRPTVETWVEQHPDNASFRAMRAWLRAEVADEAGARSDLEIYFAQDLGDRCERQNGLHSVAQAVLAAAKLGDEQGAQWCRRGHSLLSPYLSQWITVADVSVLDGPVARVAALASSIDGEVERALIENDLARSQAQAAGASLFSWQAIRDRGAILARAGQWAEAVDEFEEAASRFRSAGLQRQSDAIEQQIAECQSQTQAARRSEVAGDFRRHGNVWHVGIGGDQVVVRHLKGMAMIHALLAAPGQEISATMLAAVAEGESAATVQMTSAMAPQAVIDDRAVAAYRQRLDEISAELDRADRRGDVGGSRRLSDEFDALASELAATQGLGGRSRKMSDEGERARVRVTKSIRSSIDRIGDYNTAAAEHLERTVKTGRFCIYQPDPRQRVEWRL